MGNQSLRILYIANAPEIGGANRSLELLVGEFSRRGNSIEVVLPAPGGASKLFENTSVSRSFVSYDKPGKSSTAYLGVFTVKWLRLLNRFKPDVVHANGSLAARSIGIACALLRIPVVCHIRFDLGESYYAWAFKRIAKPACFIYVSHSLKKSLTESLGAACPQSRHLVVFNAVQADERPLPPPRENVHRIGIIGNLQPVKGHEDFLAMAAELLSRGHLFEFRICGADLQKQGRLEELQQKVVETNLKEHVFFDGFVHDVIGYIDDLDVLVCASHEEPFGRTAIEAMSRGKPVIATNVGGLPEIVRDGENGFVVEPRSPNALADAVEKLTTNQGLRTTMFRDNPRRVNDVFSAEAHADTISDIYDTVIQSA